MEHRRAALPLPVLDVPYEELVDDQECWIRRITEPCGLEWDPRCLELHRIARPMVTASAWQRLLERGRNG